MKISIIIPAYNEENYLAYTLKNITDFLDQKSYNYEVIVVNDGSLDQTEKNAKQFIPIIKNFNLISYKKNRGKGYAIKKGVEKASGDFVVFFDADNSTSIEHIEKVWPFFKNEYDIVIGSRNPKDAKGARQAQSQILIKRIFGICGNFFIRLLTVKNIYDTQCGFKIFTKKAINNIIMKTTVDRWALDVEILYLAQKMKYKIGIVPVEWFNCTNSHVGLNSYFLTLYEVLKIKINFLRGKYKI